MNSRLLTCAALVAALPAAAQAADPPAPICADRPSKATGPCTVPAGKWQVETGLIDWTHDQSDGVTTDVEQWATTGIKYGISDGADVEVWISPFDTLRISGAGDHQRHSGIGDTMVRMKYALTSDSASVHVAIDPFVKLPTANHNFGNGKVEGGVVLPIVIALGKSPLTLSVGPEVDLVAKDSGGGYHLATQQVANLGVALNNKLSVSGELWGRWQRDLGATTHQASVDGAIAYLVTNDVQIDGGANFGLNRQTPDVEVYTGISARF